MTRRRILILGGGLSGLTAGIELLEDGGADRRDVTLLCADPHPGGKASSWREPDGRLMETGFHAIFGYYHALRSLLDRVGRDTTDPRWFTSNRGQHVFYEPQERALHRVHIPRGPLDLGALASLTQMAQGWRERAALTAFAARMAAWFRAHRPEEIDPALDELSFTEFCLARGLTLELSRKVWFRYVLDLAFNYPAQGSAYVGAYGFRMLCGWDASEVLYLNGGLSEIIVEPLTARFTALGGRIHTGRRAEAFDLDADARIVRGVQIGTPGGGEDVLRWGEDFDVVVCALPIDALRAVLRASPDFERTVFAHPWLRDIWHLRTVASLSLRVWSPHTLVPPDLDTVVMGLPQPAATLIDYTQRVDELRSGPWRSVLEFEGQEGLHGDLTDEEIARLILTRFADLPFARMRPAWIEDALRGRNGWAIAFRRNADATHRYLLMEPGHWKYRPDPATCPYHNLVLAGDWVKGTQPTASMEAAVRSGQVAARLAEAT